jgi:hypothetical protein
VIDRSRQRPSAHNIYGQPKKLNPIGNGRCRVTVDSCGKQGHWLSPEVQCRWRQTKCNPDVFVWLQSFGNTVLLRAFTKLRKATISFVMSVCPSVRQPTQKNSVPTERIWMKCDIWVFFENRAVYEIMWKSIVEPWWTQMAKWLMRIACWVPKATISHSEYVILTAFPLQHRSPSTIRYTSPVLSMFLDD